MDNHFWGLAAIGQSVGTASRKGIMSLFLRKRLPMFKRVRRLAGKRPQTVWYSNASLIHAWMLTCAKMEWERQSASQRENK